MSSLKDNLSEKEIVLFTALCWEDLFQSSIINPVSLYRMAAEQAFIRDDRSEAVEALRRGLNAINKSHPFRMTDEFDTLITFGE